MAANVSGVMPGQSGSRSRSRRRRFLRNSESDEGPADAAVVGFTTVVASWKDCVGVRLPDEEEAGRPWACG